jgi:hypothetical protein
MEFDEVVLFVDLVCHNMYLLVNIYSFVLLLNDRVGRNHDMLVRMVQVVDQLLILLLLVYLRILLLLVLCYLLVLNRLAFQLLLQLQDVDQNVQNRHLLKHLNEKNEKKMKTNFFI